MHSTYTYINYIFHGVLLYFTKYHNEILTNNSALPYPINLTSK